jgi:hypothetical protein
MQADVERCILEWEIGRAAQPECPRAIRGSGAFSYNLDERFVNVDPENPMAQLRVDEALSACAAADIQHTKLPIPRSAPRSQAENFVAHHPKSLERLGRKAFFFVIMDEARVRSMRVAGFARSFFFCRWFHTSCIALKPRYYKGV